MATSERAITEARKYIGIKESPAGSNRQMFGEWYGMNGEPWCAIFQSYVAWNAGVRFNGATTAKGFAYCPYIVKWAKERGCWFPRGAGIAGDWVLYDFEGDGTADHVELVVSRQNGRVISIGGNTGPSSSSNGGEVLEQARSENVVLGYMRPPYDGSTSGTVTERIGNAFYERTLRVTSPNMHGEDVRRIQQRLLDLGYKLSVDGYYGPETAGQISQFQRDQHIEVDGICGPQTCERLAAPQGPAPATTTPVAAGHADTNFYQRTLRVTSPNMHGEDVRRIQQRLSNLGYKLKVDGYYGPETEGQIRAFQRDQHIEIDGVFGPQTAGRLDA